MPNMGVALRPLRSEQPETLLDCTARDKKTLPMEPSTDISEAAILLKPARLCRLGMSGTAPYDIIRAVWKVDRQRAECSMLAFAIVTGKIVGAYAISSWHAANTTPYLSGRRDQSEARYAGRFEFTGQVASSKTRDKYLGLAVNHLFGRGQMVRYLNR